MDRFSKFNPKVTFLFFVLIIVLTLILFHPFYLIVSLAGSFFYKIKLEGKRAFLYFIKFIIPLIFFVAVFNMLFTHYGATVLFTAFDMNFTFEGLFYGFCQGMMFSSVIMWFSCYSVVVTSERFLAVAGRISPNCAIVFSMVLSFIPRLKKNAEEIKDARMLVNNGKGRLKKELDNFSALITMTLEESIEVSDSMKARGFGRGRVPYSKYRFLFKDGVCLFIIILIFAEICVMKVSGSIGFIFEPDINMEGFCVFPFITFFIISFLPVIIDLTEDIRWFYLKQKI